MKLQAVQDIEVTDCVACHLNHRVTLVGLMFTCPTTRQPILVGPNDVERPQ